MIQASGQKAKARFLVETFLEPMALFPFRMEKQLKEELSLDAVYGPSDDIVVREIDGELIIVPLAAGIGDEEDELYTMNETGRAIWGLLDGQRSLKEVAEKLSSQYKAEAGDIEKDVTGLVKELLKRRMLVKI